MPPVHPGDVLQQWIDEDGLTAQEIADGIKVPLQIDPSRSRRRQRAITAEPRTAPEPLPRHQRTLLAEPAKRATICEVAELADGDARSPAR